MANTDSSKRVVRAAVIAAGSTAAAAVVAIAARAPLSRSTPIDGASASAPIAALFMLLLGAGILALTALMVLGFRQRRRKQDPEEREAEDPEVRFIWRVAVTLLPFALGGALILAGVTGSKRAINLPALRGGFGTASGRATPAAGGRTGYALPAWLPWTILAIVVAAVVAGIAVLVLRGRRLPADEPEPSITGEAVKAAIAALEADADPRRAVIAAYAAMQRTLDAHGLARSPSEAPREFLRRVLTANRAAERDAGTLTGLFEEARFSSHPISERARDRALSALKSLELDREPQATGAR